MNLVDTKGDKVLVIINYMLLALITFAMLYPFWDMLIQSVSPRSEIFNMGFRFFTLHPDFTAWNKVLASTDIWRGFYNSVVRVVIGTLISVVLTSLTAYPLSKKYMPMNKVLTAIMLFTMMFGGGLIPGYLLIRNLHMIDTIWSLVIPGSVNVFNVIIMRNFLRFIPESLEESARIDGASEFRIWYNICLPLSKPVIATIALWVAVNHWNAYFDTLIYINDRNKYPLPIILRRILLENQISQFVRGVRDSTNVQPTDEGVKAATIMFSTLPIVMVYPFLQKYFMRGIMLGSVKE